MYKNVVNHFSPPFAFCFQPFNIISMENILTLHPILEMWRIALYFVLFCFFFLPAGGMSYCYAGDSVKTDVSCYFKLFNN